VSTTQFALDSIEEAEVVELIEPIEEVEDESCPPGVDPALWETWKSESTRKDDEFLSTLKRGMEGHNIGLGNGLAAINTYIYGTHKARYYLIGGESGSGKTTMADFMYVFNAWSSAKELNRPIKIFYFSFEVSKKAKLFKWCSHFIFMKHGLRLHADYLQGLVNGNLVSKEHAVLAIEAYGMVKEMMKDVHVTEHVLHPTKIFETMVEEHFAKHGILTRSTPTVEQLKKNPKLKGFVTGYKENNPDLVTLIVLDHMALTASELGLDTKGTMDKLSKYCIVMRNLFYATPIILQQFSTDMMSTYRDNFGKKNDAAITPTRLDFGDSKSTFRDACVVLGIVKPQSQISTGLFYDYNVSKEDGLGDYFTALYLMKNRYGPSNRMMPLFLDFIAGVAYDLPKDPNNHFLMEPWFEQAKQLEQICLQYSPKQG